MYKTIIAVLFGIVLSLIVNVAFAETNTPAIKPVPQEDFQRVHQYDPLINKWADYYSIPPELIARMIWFESRGNKYATSPAGAMGLMQVMPYHFWSTENPYDPDTNIMNGSYILWNNYQATGNWEDSVRRYFGVVGMDYWGTTAESYCANIFDYTKPVTKPVTTLPDRVFPLPDVKTTVAVENHWGTSEVGATDLFANSGTKVVAISGGTVYFVRYDASGGYCLYIVGNDGLDYYYAHFLSWPLVSTGQYIATGTLLGYVGNTGNAVSTPPHLHLGIGYGIGTGTGASGGAGIGFDAISLLRKLQKQ